MIYLRVIWLSHVTNSGQIVSFIVIVISVVGHHHRDHPGGLWYYWVKGYLSLANIFPPSGLVSISCGNMARR